MKKNIKNTSGFSTIIIVLILILICFTGCQISDSSARETVSPPTVETPYYTLESIDGEAYLAIKDADTDEDVSFGGIADYHLYFSSVAEMREKLMNGTLSKNQLITLRQFSKMPNVLDETGKIKIPNLNQLSELDWKDATITRVCLLGERYEFDIQIKGATGSVVMYPKDVFDSKLQSEYDILDNPNLKVERQEKENQDVDEYIVTSPHAKTKRRVYTHTNSFGTYIFFETYCLESKYDDCSETIPADCRVFFESNSGYYLGLYMRHFEKPLSLEDLTSFKLKPFESVSDNPVTQ